MEVDVGVIEREIKMLQIREGCIALWAVILLAMALTVDSLLISMMLAMASMLPWAYLILNRIPREDFKA